MDSKLFHILIYSSSKEHQKKITIFLKQESEKDCVNTHTTVSEKETSQALKNNNFSIALLDLTTKEKDAFTILKLIRKQDPNLPVVVMVPDNDFNLIKKAFSAGAQEFIYASALTYPEHIKKTLLITLDKQDLLQKIRKTTREQFHNVLNQCIECMIVIDEKGLIRYLNDSATQLLFKASPNPVGTPLDIPLISIDNINADASSSLNNNLVTLIAHSNTSIEMILRLSADKLNSMLCRATEIVWDRNKAFLVALHDITDIKRMAELKAEIQEKERLEKMKDELIGVISHELRTPLTIIKTAISNLKDGVMGEMTDDQKKIVATTDRNVERLSRMINNLLDMSRLESGHIKINRRHFDLKPILDDVLHGFQDVASTKNIALSLTSPAALPEIFGDPDMVTQVLINLVNNAMHYAKSKIQIRVKAVLQNNGDTALPNLLQISVEDDGIGIAKEHLSLVFDKFRQINRATGGSGYKGTGLGLAICKQIIDLHAGHIWVESEPDQGARFYFTLPQYDEHDDFIDAFGMLIKKAEQSNSNLAVIVLCIDQWELIQKKCAEKDIACTLSDVSRIIRTKALRASDFFHFRRDTREFMLVFSNTGHDTALSISQRIQNLTKNYFFPSTHGKHFVNFNRGISVYPEDATTARELIQHALQDLQKNNGK